MRLRRDAIYLVVVLLLGAKPNDQILTINANYFQQAVLSKSMHTLKSASLFDSDETDSSSIIAEIVDRSRCTKT